MAEIESWSLIGAFSHPWIIWAAASSVLLSPFIGTIHALDTYKFDPSRKRLFPLELNLRDYKTWPDPIILGALSCNWFFAMFFLIGAGIFFFHWAFMPFLLSLGLLRWSYGRVRAWIRSEVGIQ